MVNKERCFTKEEIMKSSGEFALRFSEGNKALENLLNYCYSNNIRTRSCCIGHEDNPDYLAQAYVSFEIDEQQFDMFANAIEIVLGSTFGDKVSISLNKNKNTYILMFSNQDIQQRDIFFNLIKNTISLCNSYQTSDNEYIDIFRIFEKLINSCEKENAISLQFDSKNTILQFTKNKYIEVFQTIAPQLLPINKDNTILLNYLESLNSLDEFNIENINNSFNLSDDDINKIKKLSIMNPYTKNN